MTDGRFENVLLSLLQMVAHYLMNIPHKNQGPKLGRLKLQNNVLLKLRRKEKRKRSEDHKK